MLFSAKYPSLVMTLDMAKFTSVPLFLGTILAWAVVRCLGNLLAPGVRNIPGPILAKLSNLYRLYSVSKGDSHVSLATLHRKYGDNVRLGPHVVSICNLEDVSKVYGIKGGFVKASFSLPSSLSLTIETKANVVNERYRATSMLSSSSSQTAPPPKLYLPR